MYCTLSLKYNKPQHIRQRAIPVLMGQMFLVSNTQIQIPHRHRALHTKRLGGSIYGITGRLVLFKKFEKVERSGLGSC